MSHDCPLFYYSPFKTKQTTEIFSLFSQCQYYILFSMQTS
nr:MAG TPA: hypothetical protein [Caudoviricetes sp.]